jgi:hypothetical protein
MKMKTLVTFFFALSIAIVSYPQTDVDILANWMTGSFSSEEQAYSDTNYFNIELEMVQIWNDRPDGPWIYVEQAAADYKEKPYRQRVYQLKKRNDGKIESIIYTIPHPLRFAGDFRKDIPLLRLTPDSLGLREGCDVVLFRVDEGYFDGGTVGNKCKSDLRGASYATSSVTIMEDRVLSWDRGFDENNKQVWGAENGGYVFIKKRVNMPKLYPKF